MITWIVIKWIATSCYSLTFSPLSSLSWLDIRNKLFEQDFSQSIIAPKMIIGEIYNAKVMGIPFLTCRDATTINKNTKIAQDKIRNMCDISDDPLLILALNSSYPHHSHSYQLNYCFCLMENRNLMAAARYCPSMSRKLSTVGFRS